MNKKTDLHLRVSNELKDSSKMYAIKDGRTLSSFVEAAIREKIARMKENEKE